MEGHGFGLDGSRGWASSMWAMLNEGGIWAVPRSGLVFRKQGTLFILHDRMPWIPEMPWPEREWAEIQRDDIEGIAAMFASIGVTVQEIEV
jgi:hypothetical protein